MADLEKRLNQLEQLAKPRLPRESAGPLYLYLRDLPKETVCGSLRILLEIGAIQQVEADGQVIDSPSLTDDELYAIAGQWSSW